MLEELKNKWFVDVSAGNVFPPQARLPGSLLQPHTDGNLVEPVIDGAPLMAEFYRRSRAIIDSSNPGEHELWIAQWRLDPVKLLGQTSSSEDAETMIAEVAAAGAKVFFLGSGHIGRVRATRTSSEKLIAAGGQGAADKRIPIFGSQHQKFYVFRGPANSWLALLGSADLNYSRWDTPGHAANNPDRSSQGEGPSHDVTLRVQGPAVHDIALSFAERWNDGSNRQHTVPTLSSTISTDFLNEPPSPAGPHSVQVLRTYGHESKRAYSWSGRGEFTIWAAYLNAVKQANKYIYIEDQYFYPFNKPSAYNDLAGQRRDSDIVYQLGEAIKRGVDVIGLVPSRKGSHNPTNIYQLQARQESAHYLKTVAESHPEAGRFVICNLAAGKVDPVIHSKLMVVDDEFALVGSANVCQRSMTYDTEIHLGVVDANNQFARDLRLALWQEHLDLNAADSILEPSTGIDAFRSNAASNAGRLKLSPSDAGRRFIGHGLVMKNFMDPYRGPDRS